MKKLSLFFAALVLAIAAQAQTMNVVVGNVTYQFPASQTGIMEYADGTTLTIMGKTFTISDISQMYLDDTEVTDNLITVTYNGNSASVVVAGNVAQYVEPTLSGAHVSIVQSTDLSADNAGEITYSLSGSSSDGEFYMSGSYKATVELNGLTLTNVNPVNSGAAVHIQNGKRINVKVITGTTNTLTDAASGSQKGCLYVKGHAEFKQKGTLNVYGNVKHAIKSGEYITVKNATINVLSAVGDGISCNQYFLMESGTINIEGIGDDGIQCDLDGTESTGELADHEDEDSGNMYISGGSITINTSAIASKGMKCVGDMNITGGTINITTTGKGAWDEEDLETKAACCLSSDANMNVSGGTLTLKSTGSGGKGMKCDGFMNLTGGTIDVTTTGGLYYNNGSTENTNYTGNTDNVNSDYYSSPKGIKAGLKTASGSSYSTTYTYSGGLEISGATITVTTSGNNGEGIESKNQMTINDGVVTVNSRDDGINSAREMYLKGGTVTVVASNNDGIDANADLYISGGTIIACGASTPECGLDAAEGYHLYITGGTVLAIGGDNNAVTATTGSQCVLSTSGTVTAGSTISVKNNSGSTLASFTVPSNYSSSGSSNPWGGPGGPGGGGGTKILISCSGLTSGTSYTVNNGSSSSNATASTSTSGGMGPGGW